VSGLLTLTAFDEGSFTGNFIEPGIINTPKDHRKIPIGIACYDLDEVNHSDALLVYMKHYKSLDGSPIGTDSTWETGYAVAHGKILVMYTSSEGHVFGHSPFPLYKGLEQKWKSSKLFLSFLDGGWHAMCYYLPLC